MGRKAKAAAAKAAGGKPDPAAAAAGGAPPELPASLINVNAGHYVQVQRWLEAIEGNPILSGLGTADPLSISAGGSLVRASRPQGSSWLRQVEGPLQATL